RSWRRVKGASEFLRAVTTATEGYFEQFAPVSAAYLDEICAKLSDVVTDYGRERDRVIFFEGMLWGVKLNLRARALAQNQVAEEQGLDPATGLEKAKPS